MRTKTVAALLISTSALAGSASAGEVLMLESTPSVEELRGYLAPEKPRRTRGIEIVAAPAGAPSTATMASPTAAMTEARVAAEPRMAAEPEPQPIDRPATRRPQAQPEEVTVETEVEMVALPSPPAAEPTTIGYRVQFAYDSADILGESKPFLDQMGQVLRAEPELALVVEGHTDARGNELYNLGLSQRRAEAVKAYLARHWQVEPARLSVEGKGEAAPLTADPNDAQNRRVQFRPVG